MLETGDLFILGPRTNAQFRHAVLPTEEPCGPQVSLVLRDVDSHVEAAFVQRKVQQLEEQRAQKRQKAEDEAREQNQ